jgi:hypothetical protein
MLSTQFGFRKGHGTRDCDPRTFKFCLREKQTNISGFSDMTWAYDNVLIVSVLRTAFPSPTSTENGQGHVETSKKKEMSFFVDRKRG